MLHAGWAPRTLRSVFLGLVWESCRKRIYRPLAGTSNAINFATVPESGPDAFLASEEVG